MKSQTSSRHSYKNNRYIGPDPGIWLLPFERTHRDCHSFFRCQ